jgi:hypothetical protein
LSLGHFIAIVSLLTLAASASAQTTVPRPTVTRFNDVFVQQTDKFVVNERIAFKTKDAPSARRLVKAGLQARIFPLENNKDVPNPVGVIDGCQVFASVVLKAKSVDGSEAVLPALDYRWLAITDSLNGVEPGRYLLVFENNGPSEDEFRLKVGDQKDYFATGLVFTVNSSNGVTIDEVRSAYFDRRDKLGELRQLIGDTTRRIPCYTYKPLTAAISPESDYTLASLELCTSNDKSQAIASMAQPGGSAVLESLPPESDSRADKLFTQVAQ